jgi:hypothetical protein
MGKQRLFVGYLYRNRAVTGLVLKSEEAACQKALGECLWDVFECPGRTMLCPLGRDLGTLTGSPGGIWARRPWTVLRQLLQDRWLECFGGRCFGARIYR